MDERDPTRKSHEAIEESLKKVYQETVEEDIPDRFVSLLKRLRERDTETRQTRHGDEEVQ